MRTVLAALGLSLLVGVGSAGAADLEKTEVTLGVGGKSLLYYLPLTLALQKGFFEAEGLEVTVDDFKGGSQSLQALVEGAVDVVTGGYEHTIRMQAEGQDIVAVIELGDVPAIALVVRSDLKDRVKTPADLRGMRIGVTSPGSSTNNIANVVLGQHGVAPDEVSFIGVGGGPAAVAAMIDGEVDALSNTETAISALVAGGHAWVLADTRTQAATIAVLGEPTPAAVLYLRRSFIEENPNTVQAFVNAFYKTLQWMQAATPDEIADTVPPEYLGGDRELYLQALVASLPGYSKDGMISQGGMRAASRLLAFDKTLDLGKVDLSRTFDDRFVTAAQGKP